MVPSIFKCLTRDFNQIFFNQIFLTRDFNQIFFTPTFYQSEFPRVRVESP